VDEKNRILIVDDDIGMCETLSDILSDEDYNIDIANEGYTAIDMISKNPYDLVLMDIKMPEINGVETYKVVNKTNPCLKVILMTAYSVEDLVNDAISEGAYGIIYKPMDIPTLLEIINKILKNINILIVDDNPYFCRFLKDSLESMNYNVAIKYDGEQAINYIKENNIDIIFIDVKLPGLNGLEVFLTIKKINPNIDAIMIHWIPTYGISVRSDKNGIY